VVDLTVHLLAGVLSQHGGADLVRQALPTVLTWVRFLPPSAVDELAAEFMATVHAAAEVETLAPVSSFSSSGATRRRSTPTRSSTPPLHNPTRVTTDPSPHRRTRPRESKTRRPGSPAITTR
jgi:hypothetical protein